MQGVSLPVCVTGSSGFIGRHLCGKLSGRGGEMIGLDRADPPDGVSYKPVRADINHFDQIAETGATWVGKPMIHLAAEAEVLTPWELIPATFCTNLVGTWNLLTAFRPGLFVFPSTCSVYGTSSVRRSLPQLSAVKPLSLYGASKSMGEILLRDWSKETGNAAVALRLGNVIGAGCRGLIPYLVRHAKRYPEGDVPAELRGRGMLLRDYTPVEFVVRIFQSVLDKKWKAGTLSIFNVGTARGLSNREIADMIQRTLEREGFRIDCRWDNPVPASEAVEIVLNCDSLEKHFDVKLPSTEEVEASIEESVLCHLRT